MSKDFKVKNGLEVTTNITASGDISSSGTLDANAVTDGLAAAIVSQIDNDEIPIAKLAEDAVTVTAGTGLTGGGAITLGGSGTLNVIGGDGITANANDIAITAAQTTIESILKADLVIGEDAQTKIDFETADEIHFYANNAQEMIVQANVVAPGADDGTALGDANQRWSDLFLAEGGVINFDNGDVTITQTGNKLAIAGTDGTSFIGDITASGNISASGTIFADSFQSVTGGGGIDFNDSLDLTGNITASGNISASGDIKASTFTAVGNVDFNGDLDVDGTTNLDVVDIDGAVNMASTLIVSSHISASGNITASGNISGSNTSNLTVGGTITAEQITSTDDMTVTDDLTVGGNINIADNIVHTGDTDTNIAFSTDQITFKAGDVEMIRLVEGSNDSVVINDLSADVDFRVESNNNVNMLKVDGGTDKVGIGTGAPNSELTIQGSLDTSGSAGHITASGDISASGVITGEGLVISDDAEITDDLSVGGVLSVAGDIQHIGDTDTKIVFGTDTIAFRAGATELLSLTEASPDTISFGAAISSHITASGNISGSSTSTINVGGNITTAATGSFGEINLDDNKKIKIGTGDDLQIFHDATDSIITNATGDLKLTSTGDDVIIQGADDVDIKVQGGETAAKFGGNGGVDLYHNNVKKFETKALGIDVTGNINASSHITASGDISASGVITGEGLVISDDALITDDLEVRGNTSGSSTSTGSFGNIVGNSISLPNNSISGDVVEGGTIASITISELGGALDANNQNITNIDVDSGAIDGTVIGGNSAAAGTFTTINATSLNVTNITSSIVTSSILQTEGSNIFGDASTDTHTFNGHITASNNISASGTIKAATLDADAITDGLAGVIVAEIDNDEIPIAKLAEDAVTVTAGTGLTGGGSITLGGSATVNVIGGDGITANANDMAITAAQTTIESILKADLVIGEDAQTKIDFETANEIHFDVNNVELLNLTGAKISGSLISTGSFGKVIATTIDGTLSDSTRTDITSILATDLVLGEDAQTKIDFETADEIHFYANNAQEMVIQANVVAPGADDGTALGDADQRWSDLFLASGGVINFNNGDATITGDGSNLDLVHNQGNFEGGIRIGTFGDIAFANVTDGDLNFGTDVKLFMSQSSGNVGIGDNVTQPAEKLTVAGNISASGDLFLNKTLFLGGGASDFSDSVISASGETLKIADNGNVDIIIDKNNSAGTGIFSVKAHTGQSTRLMVSSSGNVGIGTTSPNMELSVNGEISASGMYITSSTGLVLERAGHEKVALQVANADRFQIRNQNDNRNDLVILDSGEVSIGGNDSPTHQLVVAGEISSSGDIITPLTGSFGGIKLNDAKRIQLGTGNDLQIFHDGSNSNISDSGTGALNINGSVVRVRDITDGNTIAEFTDGAGTLLKHNNSTKFETTTTGIKVSGNISASSHITASGVISASGGFVGDGSNLTGVTSTVDIDGFDAFSGVPHATQDEFLISDNGTEKRATMTMVANGGFALVSGDATIAAGGALTNAAAQTNINSILATDLILGEDAQTAVNFETVNEIHFDVNNVELLNMAGSIVSGSLISTSSFGAGFFDNKVGIGTTSPDHALHIVYNNSTTEGSISNNNAVVGLQIENTNASGVSAIHFRSSDADGYLLYDDNGANAGDFHFKTDGQDGTSTVVIKDSGNVGIGIDAPQNTVHISGSMLVGTGSLGGHITASGNYSGSASSTFTIGGKLIAGSKSFLIDKPEGGKLEYGVLEGQQNDVFYRGELKGDNVIYLPQEWEWLVDENTITTQLTGIGKYQELYFKEIKDNKVFIDINGVFKTKENIHCYYIIHGTRKDIELIRNHQ